MIEQGIAGKIINISSISGERPYPNRTAFSASKAALNMMTKSTALELAPYRIRVNAIAPGATPYDTEALENHSLIQEIPLKRTGKPEDHASAAVFLASEDSSWMTGQIMTIDGGQSLSF
jgi:NAD(P)-dependent dehydrogenase (short-subunit alcohol dehydrogenase family)